MELKAQMKLYIFCMGQTMLRMLLLLLAKYAADKVCAILYIWLELKSKQRIVHVYPPGKGLIPTEIYDLQNVFYEE